MCNSDAKKISGTWNYKTVGASPEETGHFHVTDDLRFVAFVEDGAYVTDKNQQGIHATRYWMCFEGDSLIRFKPRMDDEGWTHRYSLEGSLLFLERENPPMKWVCDKVDLLSTPDWFQKALSAMLAAP